MRVSLTLAGGLWPGAIARCEASRREEGGDGGFRSGADAELVGSGGCLGASVWVMMFLSVHDVHPTAYQVQL
jgi:hypothetical protein